MALFKQWEVLNQAVAESDNQNSPSLVPVPYTMSNSKLKKSTSKDSSSKVSPTKAEKSDTPSKVLGDCSNIERKESVLIKPVYPTIPATLPKVNAQIASPEI